MKNIAKHCAALFCGLAFVASTTTAAAATPSVSLLVNGNDNTVSVAENASVDFTWESSGVSSCSLSGDLTTPTRESAFMIWNLPDSGSRSVSLADSQIPSSSWEDPQWIEFTLTCTEMATSRAFSDTVWVVAEQGESLITVTSPAEGATVVAGKTVKVKWRSDKKELKKIQVVLHPEGTVGESVYLFDGEKKNTGSYAWKVPKDLAPGRYRVTVGWSGGQGAGYDWSGAFTVESPKEKTKASSWKFTTKDGFVVLGSGGVTLDAYLGFQEPFSARWYAKTFPELKKNYVDKKKLKVAFRYFYLPMHPNSEDRAIAAMCAGEQRKGFFEMIEEFFANSGKQYSRADFSALAERFGLDVRKFEACYDDPDSREAVQDSRAEALGKGYNGVPVFEVGDEVIQGAQEYEAFEAALR